MMKLRCLAVKHLKGKEIAAQKDASGSHQRPLIEISYFSSYCLGHLGHMLNSEAYLTNLIQKRLVLKLLVMGLWFSLWS